jgi:MoaA/NifB/PqqE/SkfB family radical SAM enzyme
LIINEQQTTFITMTETIHKVKKQSIGRSQKLSSALGTIAPTSVQLALTEACPMRCIHCNLWQTKRQNEELPTEKWMGIIDDLADWLPHRHLHFTGGEPFLRKDFLEIVRYASTEHDFVVSSNTSGVLIRQSNLYEIIDAKFNGLIFSIDAMDELHGKIRMNKSVFANNLKWMDILRHHMYITIATVIMENNLDDLIELVKFSKKVGAAGIAFQPLFQNFGAEPDSNWFKSSKIWPKAPEKVTEIIDEIIEMKNQGYLVLNSVNQLKLYKKYFCFPKEMYEYQCLVGETNLAVSPYGEVRLCYNMPPIGNVKTDMLSVLWTSQMAAQRRSIIDGCHKSCSIMNCNYNEL